MWTKEVEVTGDCKVKVKVTCDCILQILLRPQKESPCNSSTYTLSCPSCHLAILFTWMLVVISCTSGSCGDDWLAQGGLDGNTSLCREQKALSAIIATICGTFFCGLSVVIWNEQKGNERLLQINTNSILAPSSLVRYQREIFSKGSILTVCYVSCSMIKHVAHYILCQLPRPAVC
jgi:hypothetical protein